MRALSILGGGALLCVMAACGSSDTVKKVGALADRACACRELACVDAVDKEYWELAKTPRRGTQDERDEVEEHYARMRECIVKVRSASPGAAPAGAAPGEAPGAAPGAAPAGAGPAGAAPAPAPAAEPGK
jgi:hypothetical protein